MARPKIVISGAGSVGVNQALVLEKLVEMGYLDAEIILVEKGPDILQGSAQVTFIEHDDGFEYLRPGHQATGEACIEGAYTKALLYPPDAFDTGICTQENPIRFLVSEDATTRDEDPITEKDFDDNARYMHGYSTACYYEIANARSGWAKDSPLVEPFSANIVNTDPRRFSRKLKPEEYSDLQNIAFGQAGAGNGISMPYYYAYVKKALELAQKRGNLKVLYNTTIESMTKVNETGDEQYEVKLSDGSTLASSDIRLTSGRGNHELRERIEGAELEPPLEGTHYLNGMLFLDLPPTDDQELIAKLSRINFTLQADEGCAYTCVVPPITKKQALKLERLAHQRGEKLDPKKLMGQAVVYFPSTQGNQIAKYTVNKDDSSTEKKPSEWDDILANGPADLEARAARIRAQAEKFYPFLEGYAQMDAKKPLRYGTVFNAATPDSDLGKRRNVREISHHHNVTKDGCVGIEHAPKWTNAELVALTGVSHLMRNINIRKHMAQGMTREEAEAASPTLDTLLGVSRESRAEGYGPESLNVPGITEIINFQQLKGMNGEIVRPDPKDALNYAQAAGINSRIVNPYASIFTGMPSMRSTWREGIDADRRQGLRAGRAQ